MYDWFIVACQGQAISDFYPVPFGIGTAGGKSGRDSKRCVRDIVVGGADAFGTRAKIEIAAVGCLTAWSNCPYHSLRDTAGNVA